MDTFEDLKSNPFVINIPGIISTNYLDSLVAIKFNTDAINHLRENITKISKDINYVIKNNSLSNDYLFTQSKSFIMMSDALSKETILNLGYIPFQKVVLGCFECINSKINSLSIKLDNKVDYNDFVKRLSFNENAILDVDRITDNQFKEIYNLLNEIRDENKNLKMKNDILSSSIRTLDKDMYKYIDDILAQQDDNPSLQKLRDICLLLQEKQDNLENKFNELMCEKDNGDLIYEREINHTSEKEIDIDNDVQEKEDSEEIEIFEYYDNRESQNDISLENYNIDKDHQD